MASVPLDRRDALAPWASRPQEARGNPERPILLDLMAVGVYANSVWDLVHSPAPLSRARGVLRHHLDHGGHPPEVVEGLRQALERGD